MLLFPIYAVIVWALAMHWRRQWPAFVAVGCGTALLVLVARVCMALDLLPASAKIFYELLWPYTFLVGVIGSYIACLPRRALPHECQRCHYDLRGLSPLGLTCPECGTDWCGTGSGREVKPDELIPIPTRPPQRRGAVGPPAVIPGPVATPPPSAGSTAEARR